MNLTGGWWQPVLALGIFIFAHRWPVSPRIRARFVARLGEPGFIIAYSFVSAGLLLWLIVATVNAPVIVLWFYAPWQAWLTVLMMLPACLLVTMALGRPNPLSIGGWNNDYFDPSAPGIAGFCRHPLLLALALWAIAHVVPNGELATFLLFIPLAAFSLIGMQVIDRRRKMELGREEWRRLASCTALLPGTAWLSGHWRPAWRHHPWVRSLSGVLLYTLLLFAHPGFIGVPTLPPGVIALFS